VPFIADTIHAYDLQVKIFLTYFRH